MSVKIDLELQPFNTPNFVIVKMPARPRHDGWQESPKYSLAELDAQTLSALCDQFRAEIFKKAGKDDPRPTEQK
jgi:hypothetical protein